MLKSLLIRNIALIPEVRVEFAPGLNVLSGETGAGKSIIIDSLNFILGDRADKSMLRHGEDSAAVEAVFETESGSVKQTLNELLGESDDVIIINRTLGGDGKSEIRLNGRTLSLSMLKKLTADLVDIHGQHEHQSLLKVSKHIEVLDYFLPQTAAEIKRALSTLLKEYRQVIKELSAFGGSEDERARQTDILSFQIKEIKDVKLSEKEEEELLKKRDMAVNRARITEGLSQACACFGTGGEGAGITEMLDGAIRALSGISRYDERIEEYAERIQNARAEITDIAEGATSILEETDYSEKDADKLEARLDTVKLLKRKYGGSIPAVFEFLEKAEKELFRLTNSGELIEKYKKQKAALEKDIYEKCSDLSALRRATALDFEGKVKKELSELGMGGAAFKVQFAENPSLDEIENRAGTNGFDTAEFFLSPNLGEPLKPLAKIISGGEMSRFMLAVKNITSDAEGIGTMIFDEIDTGISGKMGQVVACKLASIAKGRQVICVSHLAQLAAMADKNFLISKAVAGDKTLTSVKVLKDKEKTEEVSRLSGGKDISDFAQKQAEDMIKWSEQYKKSF